MDENLVTTSMLYNGIKSSWTLDELGWKLHPAGDIRDWDGLMSATAGVIADQPELLKDKYLRRWHEAAEYLSQSWRNRCSATPSSDQDTPDNQR